MNPIEAIQSVMTRYADFDGRARRSEYWWWTLFVLVVSSILSAVPVLGVLFSLAVFVPCLAVGVRRLHDIDRSGWFLALPLGGFAMMRLGLAIQGGILLPVGSFVALPGAILILVWACYDGTDGPNQFGPDPKAGER